MISVLTNKHVITAMIVAPILAIIAYMAVDAQVSEKPHQAVKGSSYPLVAKSNCRYESGKCTMKNQDIKFDLIAETISAQVVNLKLDSDIAIEGVKIGFAGLDQDVLNPVDMEALNDEGTQWQISVNSDELADAKLQIALSINDTLYFGETLTVFTTYKTTFSQKNF